MSFKKWIDELVNGEMGRKAQVPAAQHPRDTRYAGELREYERTGELSSDLITEAALRAWAKGELKKPASTTPSGRSWDRVYDAYKNIESVVDEFDRKVWWKSLQRYLKASPHRVFSATFTANGVPAKAVIGSLAGRAAIELAYADGTYSMQVIADESGSTHSGLGNVETTEAQAVNLLHGFIRAFQQQGVSMIKPGSY